MSMPSDTSLSPCRSDAPRSIRRPSSPSPWKLYGELRGLKAPPRSTFAPARFTAAAVDSTCASFSAEHGPAMTITSSPPIRRSSITTTVLSGLNVRLASLYGSVIRKTSCTPSSTSINRGSASRCPPTAPSTVRSAPVERCTSKPISTRCAITCCTCSSVARSSITTTMDTPQSLILSVLRLRHTFEAPRLIADPFEEPPDRGRIERARVDAFHVLEHLVFALRLVDRQAERLLRFPDGERAGGALVQQAHEIPVELVDAPAQRAD